MKWEDLDYKQKGWLAKIYLNSGITSLDEMKSHYNSFADGGGIESDSSNNSNSKQKEEIYSLVSSLDNLTEAQKIAILANIGAESNYDYTKRGANNAYGLFQFDPNGDLKSYNNYLRENKLTDSAQNQINFVLNNWIGTRQNTPFDRNASYREEPVYNNYTSKRAMDDWNSGNFQQATRAFLSMYERAGKPHMEKRTNLANEWAIKYDHPLLGPKLDEVVISDTMTERGRLIADNYLQLTPYQKAIVDKYYRNPDNTYTDRGVQYMREMAYHNKTGKSEFMSDLNRLAPINAMREGLSTSRNFIKDTPGLEFAYDALSTGLTFSPLAPLGITMQVFDAAGGGG